MKWRREIDYHGSRAYGADESAAWRLSLGIAALANFVGRAFRKLRRQPGPPIVLLHDGEHSFSLLGLDSTAASNGRPAACPFPVKADPTDRRSYRVFP